MSSPLNHIDRGARSTDGPFTADFYLLGEVDFDRTLALQRRLAYELGGLADSRLSVLMCEHRDLITLGRAGSRAHIRLTNDQIQRYGAKVQWVSRGGGCIPHTPGQLAIYPVVPLYAVGWTVGEYARRFQAGLQNAMERLKIHTTVGDEQFGLWGQTGLLAAFGIAVQNWITSHGAFLNVNPPMNLFHFVDTATRSSQITERAPMSSLLAERRTAVKMANVRAAVVESLVEAFQCACFHVHAAHPWLRSPQGAAGESFAKL